MITHVPWPQFLARSEGTAPEPVSRATTALLLAFALLALSARSARAEERQPEPVVVGVLANRGHANCLARWTATAEYLSARIPGHRFEILPLGHQEVEPAVAGGVVDFILVNPSQYIELERVHGVSRIVTLNTLHAGRALTEYASAIFFRSERDDIRRMDDLRGVRVMGVWEWSFGGWQMAWREFKQKGIDPSRDFRELRFGGTHDAVVNAVRAGTVDVGIVRSGVLEEMVLGGAVGPGEFSVLHDHIRNEEDLPFLHSTRSYPEWPLAKLEQTGQQLAEDVAVSLMSMRADAAAARNASSVGWTFPHHYQPVRGCLKELGISPYARVRSAAPRDVLGQYWPWVAGTVVLLVAASTISAYIFHLNRRLRQALTAREREISERIHAEEALNRSEKLRAGAEKLAALGRLAAGVAHEINNPLTGVLTFGHLLKEKENLDEQDKEDLALIIRETNRVAVIVRELLEFAREREPLREELDVGEVVRRSFRLLQPVEAYRSVVFVEDLQDDLPPVDGDGNQLEQVFVNLMLNACEAMPEGGTLTVSARARDGKLVIRLIDSGCGIKPEHLDRIFEPFFSRKPGKMGTGMGLSVSHGIVRRHGGELTVESKDGEGATFTVVLPIMDGAPDEVLGQEEHA